MALVTGCLVSEVGYKFIMGSATDNMLTSRRTGLNFSHATSNHCYTNMITICRSLPSHTFTSQASKCVIIIMVAKLNGELQETVLWIWLYHWIEILISMQTLVIELLYHPVWLRLQTCFKNLTNNRFANGNTNCKNRNVLSCEWALDMYLIILYG